MKGFIIGLLATALAFVVMAWLLPQVSLEPKDSYGGLLGLALVFGLVNGLVKPIVKLLSLPVTLMTLGLFGIVINAAMLLLVSWITEFAFKFTLSIGGWPQDGLSFDVVVAAFIASIVLTVVQTVIGLVVRDR